MLTLRFRNLAIFTDLASKETKEKQRWPEDRKPLNLGFGSTQKFNSFECETPYSNAGFRDDEESWISLVSIVRLKDLMGSFSGHQLNRDETFEPPL